MNINITRKFEVFCYATLLFGVVGDEVSTLIGLSSKALFESNTIVEALLSNGLWIPLDLLATLICIWALNDLSTKISVRKHMIIMLLPLFAGIIRLGACINNILLFF